MNSLKKLRFESCTPGICGEPLGQALSPLACLSRASPSARFAQRRQMDREGQRAESGVGADVARRLLAPDMLLAGRERQHPAALAVGVDRLAARRPGIWRTNFSRVANRPHRARRNSAHCRATGPRRRRCRRPSRRAVRAAERDELGDHDDQQRAGLVAGLGQPRIVAQSRRRNRGSARRRRTCPRRSSGIRSSPPPGRRRRQPARTQRSEHRSRTTSR